eukprot:m.985904 g.985904  ORF g.985904 m.985904 type:complete len:208 (-) comp23987_c0_seq8:879-1502(-)
MPHPSAMEVPHAPGSPRSRRQLGGAMRPPPRAFARSHLNKGTDGEDHTRAILTISENSTIEYVNEEDDEINRLLREKGEKLDAAVGPPRAGKKDKGGVHDDTASGRGSPKNLDVTQPADTNSKTTSDPSTITAGDVDLSLVASKLQALLCVEDEDEITPSCARGSTAADDRTCCEVSLLFVVRIIGVRWSACMYPYAPQATEHLEVA